MNIITKLKWNIKFFVKFIYINIQSKGLINTTKYLTNLIKIGTIKYLFKHNKWFANYIRNKAKDVASIIIVELFLADNFDMNSIASKLPKEDREKLLKQIEQ